MATLSRNEKRVLQTFKRRAMAAFPGEILEVRVFGSKARSDATEDSDIDVLVLTASSDWRLGDAVRRIGYGLDEAIGYRLSIQVLPAAHLRYLDEHGFQFGRSVLREGLAV